jgi:hypothetical protein
MRLRNRVMVIAVLAVLGSSGAAWAQVSPAEITNPRLKQTEQTYLQQLIDLSHAIAQIQFPFAFVLSRSAGLDPKQQIGADRRGLEFINFKNQTVLKISGNYNAAFSAQMLTENQRADRVFGDVIVPILDVLPKYFSAQSDFDGFGFEISYHVRTNTRSYSYEGAQVLTIVFDKADAFKYARSERPSERQEILDVSEVYVDGKSFGLMLGQRDPSPVDEEGKEGRRQQTESASASVKATIAPPAVAATPPSPAAAERPREAAAPAASPARPPATSPAAAMPGSAGVPAAAPQATATPPPAATQADADALQAKLQAQLQALDQEGRAHDGFVDYAPPSFAIFHNQIYLQLTLRNPNVFDKNATSIYKRAAQSLDLFLAPRLKALLEKTPADPAIAGLDATVLSEFSANASSSSEAIEYVCPMAPLRRFANADITSQDLINQSVVLVNGVRIALNLQQVE